jgi:hypothetical protein
MACSLVATTAIIADRCIKMPSWSGWKLGQSASLEPIRTIRSMLKTKVYKWG